MQDIQTITGTDLSVSAGPQSPVPHVYAAMVTAMQEIGRIGVGKLGTNKDQNYKFRSIDQVYGAVSAGLCKAGLMILPSVITRELVEHQTKSGSANWRVTLKMMYTFVAAQDSSSHEVGPFFGEAFDTSDKATNKALTAAYKYMLTEVFCIPLEGTDDADSHTPEVDADSTVGRSISPEFKDPRGTTRTREPIDSGETITDVQIGQIERRLEETGVNVEAFLAKAGGIDKIADLSASSFKIAMNWIERQHALNTVSPRRKEAAVAPTPAPAPEVPQAEPASSAAPGMAAEHSFRLELVGGKELGRHTFEAAPSVGGVFQFGGADLRIIEVTKMGTPEQVCVLEYVPKAENGVKKGAK